MELWSTHFWQTIEVSVLTMIVTRVFVWMEYSKLRKQNAAMSNYLRTHDHRLHDAAMAAAKEH